MNKILTLFLALTLIFSLSACRQETLTTETPIQTNGKMIKYFTEEEVATRSTFEDCWMIIDGKVYDVSEYIASHPGSEPILEGCGMDATILYENRPMGSGTDHSKQAQKDLVQYYIGEITDNGQPTTQTDPSTLSINGSTYNPCELMTAQDLTQHFPGLTARVTQNDTVANVVGQKICFYDLSEDDMIFAQLNVQNQSDMDPKVIEGGQTAESIYRSIQEFADTVTPVNIAGAEAYFGGTGLTPGSGLHVLTSNKLINFSVIVGLGFGNNDTEAHLQIEKDLAEKILKRL